MAAHARLKNEFMVDEKYHNLMTWLIFLLQFTIRDIIVLASNDAKKQL